MLKRECFNALGTRNAVVSYDHDAAMTALISSHCQFRVIWGGDATLNRVHKLLYDVVFLGQSPPLPLYVHPLQPGEFFRDKKFSLSAFPVNHQGPDNFGFCFQEHTKRPFLVEKAEALGIPPGPERGMLVAGKSITLKDGREIHPDDVLGAASPGVKYVYVGDCGNVDNLYDVAADADCLVIEATYLEDEADMARQFRHMTAAGAARFAKDAGAKGLILNHISRRSREFEIRREAQAFFPDAIVARDFDHFVIARDRLLLRVEANSDGTAPA